MFQKEQIEQLADKYIVHKFHKMESIAEYLY